MSDRFEDAARAIVMNSDGAFYVQFAQHPHMKHAANMVTEIAAALRSVAISELDWAIVEYDGGEYDREEFLHCRAKASERLAGMKASAT